MSNKNVKRGDKVWVFLSSCQQITSGKVGRIYHLFGADYVQIYFDNGVLSGGFRMGREAFATRKELCEHYRKIFEDEQDNHHSV